MFSTRAEGSMANLNVRDSSCTRLTAASMSRKGPCRGSVASTMFSATVITGMSMKCWCTMPMPRSMASRGEAMRIRSPSSRISPSSGW
jgi:hypothetical protein